VESKGGKLKRVGGGAEKRRLTLFCFKKEGINPYPVHVESTGFVTSIEAREISNL